MLSTRELCLQKGFKTLLEGLNLSFRHGCVSAILGPNGAGKSSLLKLLSGEWQPSSGEVFWRDTPLAHQSIEFLGRHRAFLHQETHMDFSFSVEDVVLLGRMPHSRSHDAPHDRSIAREALQRMELEELAGRDYTTLSGGEKQRVQIARTLVQIWYPDAAEGNCWLLDEPVNNLDLVHQQKVLRLARERAKAGTTVIAVLHDLNLARRHADDAVLLRDGKLVAQGDVTEVLQPPQLEQTFGLPFDLIQPKGARIPLIVARDTDPMETNDR